MSSPEAGHQRGEVFCRPSDWIDIVKFFLLNYGLHGLTVMTTPGSTSLSTVLTSVISIFSPNLGIGNALQVLSRLAIIGRTDLQTALRAGALCMVVPSHLDHSQSEGPMRSTLEDSYVHVVPEFMQVQGQYPASATRQHTRRKESADPEKPQPQREGSCLIQVPFWFTVDPLLKTRTPIEESRKKVTKPIIENLFRQIKGVFFTVEEEEEEDDTPTVPTISCNYSITKTTTALVQIIYGSFELYGARGDQFEKYGYAAYSLTVIPYVLMSIANLFASLSGPQYPSMHIVYYRGLERDAEPSRVRDSTTDTTAETEQAGDEQVPGATDTVTGQPRDEQLPGGTNTVTDCGSQTHSAQEILTKTTTEPQTPIVDDRSSGWTEKNYPAGWWTKGERETSEKMISGAVGYVYGDPLYYRTPRRRFYVYYWILLYPMMLCLQAAPYAIIGILTKFDKRQSTQSQRSWIMCWLVICQFGAVLPFWIMRIGAMRRRMQQNPVQTHLLECLLTILQSVANIAGFVVVAQMIAAGQICRKL